jgi:hypothetical protein
LSETPKKELLCAELWKERKGKRKKNKKCKTKTSLFLVSKCYG